MLKIDVWYGESDTNPTGPIEGILLDDKRIQITDREWLEEMGWLDENEKIEDRPYVYDCNHLPDSYYVSYDDYAWSTPGFCLLKNRY